MSDRYVHLQPLDGAWDHRHDNLTTLARHLALNADAIRAGGGLAFDDGRIVDRPSPQEAVTPGTTPVSPLAHGPQAGLAPEPDEDWPGYRRRVFGILDSRPFMTWLQSPMWRKTDPSPEGVALRIAYVLDYGVPFDFVEIAMGQAYSDYDMNGFLWEKIDLLPPSHLHGDQLKRRRNQPEWVGAVELERRRTAIKPDFFLPPDEVPFSAGLPGVQVRALAAQIGRMPGIFHDFLLFSGRRTINGEAGAYADRLVEISRLARDRLLSREMEADDPVPPDAIFIGVREGRHLEFILGGERADSPVFLFNVDSGRVTQVGFSIFDWIAAFMRVAGPPDNPPSASLPSPVGRGADGTAGRSFWQVLRDLFK